MLLLEHSFYIDRIDDEASGIALDHHKLIDVLLLVGRPQFVKSDQQVLQHRKVIDKILITRALNLKVLLVESRYIRSELDEMAIKRDTTFDNMLGKYILLRVDPKMIECFLSAVEDLW